MQFVFIVHSVAEKLNYSKCKHDVSRAVGIPFSGDSGHQGTESPLQEIWWGFRPVGIPSSGDSVQWGFRVHTILCSLNRGFVCLRLDGSRGFFLEIDFLVVFNRGE